MTSVIKHKQNLAPVLLPLSVFSQFLWSVSLYADAIAGVPYSGVLTILSTVAKIIQIENTARVWLE